MNVKHPRLGEIRSREVRGDVYDAEGESPAKQHVRVDPVPRPAEDAAPPPTPQPADEVVATRLGVSMSAEQMEMVRRAFYSDLDRRENPAPSATQWMVRAVRTYLELSPSGRRRARQRVGEAALAGRKVPYSIQVPLGTKAQLQEAVREERVAGRRVQVSGLVREALAVEVEAATGRAGGELPQ